MRRKRIQKLHEAEQLLSADLLLLADLIQEGHKRSYGCVVLLLFDVRRHFLDGLVERSLERLHGLRHHDILQRKHALQEAAAALDRAVVPRRRGAVIAHEEHIDAKRIRTVLRNDVQRIHNIALRLTHLLAVRAEYHALRRALLIGLRRIDLAEVVEEVVPETGINQVARHMLHAAVVPVDRHPVVNLLSVRELLAVMRVAVAKEIPGGTRPLRHGIGLTLCRTAALRAGAVHERLDLRKRRLTVLTGLKVIHIGQAERKLLVRNRDHTAVRAVNQRNRLAPVTLTVKGPVLHLELHTRVADALLREEFEHARNRILLVGHTVQEVGVNHDAVAAVGFLLEIAALNDRDNLSAEALCELVVALVVRRHRHNRAGAVAHHDIVRNENRNLLAADRIDGRNAFDADTCLVLDELGALKLGFTGSLLAVNEHGVHVFDLRRELVNQRVLGRNDHEGHAEERVTARRINLKLLIEIL